MKTKFYLAALALPMLFTACSDDFNEAGGIQNNAPAGAKGIMVNLSVDKDMDGEDPSTRAHWTGNSFGFDKDDQLSMFWLRDAGITNYDVEDDDVFTEDADAFNSAIKYEYNSVYTYSGTNWESESMLFYGGNVLVYPADMAAYKPGTITLKVPSEQKVGDELNYPYISNYIYVKEAVDSTQKDNLPGYKPSLYTPTKPAANRLRLTLNLQGAEKLSTYGLTVQKVELVSKRDAPVFATEATIVGGDRTVEGSANVKEPYDGGVFTYGDDGAESTNTIVRVLKANAVANVKSITSSNITKENDSKYLVDFILLPSNTTFDDGENMDIVVYTNCGRVTLSTPSDVASFADLKATAKEAGKTLVDYIAAEKLDYYWMEKTTSKGVKTDTVSVADAIAAVTKYNRAPVSATGKFVGEEIGGAFYYTANVDMSKADIDNTVVEEDANITALIKLYKDLGKEEKLTVIFDAPKTTFPDLSAQSIKDLNELGFTVKSNDTEIVLATTGAVETFIEKLSKGDDFGDAKLSYVLGEGSWTMNDTIYLPKTNSEADSIKVGESATLTIKATSEGSLTAPLVNNGSLTFNGNVTIASESFVNNGTMTIAKGQTLNVNQAKTVAGIITNNGKLYTNGTIETSANISNAGSIASTGATGGWTNTGVITIIKPESGYTITYINDNSNGEIILNERDDEVKVGTGNEGKITYVWKSADSQEVKKEDSDKFTYLIFNSNITLKPATSPNLENVSFEIGVGASVNIKANDLKIADLTVKENAELYVFTGNKITCEDLTNKGEITVGGTIKHSGTYTNEGTVVKQGDGSIVQVD